MPDTVLITTSKLDSLAEMVAAKSEESLPLTIDEMKLAIQSINTLKQAKTVTPTTSTQTITPDSAYGGLSQVTVNPIPSNYIIPSGTLTITANAYYDVTSYDEVEVNVPTSSEISLQAKTNINPTTSSQTITADSGYDGLSSVQINAMPGGSVTSPTSISGTSASISTGTNTLTLSKTISVTPRVTTAGYVSAGTAGNSAVSLTASVTTKAAATITPTTTNQTIASGTYLTGTQTIQGDSNLVAANIKKGISIFNVAGSYEPAGVSLQAKTGITPTEESQTITADTGYDGLSSVQIDAISSTYVGSGITTCDSDSLIVSGATVTAPAGYYASAASKSVATMTLPTAAASSASSGYTSKATISRSTAAQYINIPAGYNTAASYYTISATPNGSVTAPSSISGTTATVSTGTNTLTLTKTVSVTPNVTTAGYISSGTAGNSSVSLTASVTTKAAATITPGTTSQTIASGTYLTGTQTIAGDANLVGSNILSGTSIFGVAGTVAFQTIYSGSNAPSSSTGVNGDVYIQT